MDLKSELAREFPVYSPSDTYTSNVATNSRMAAMRISASNSSTDVLSLPIFPLTLWISRPRPTLCSFYRRQSFDRFTGVPHGISAEAKTE
jgi:hypothetical protein